MARYAGSVGYVTEEEKVPGVWSAVEVVRQMKGDVIRAASVFQGAERFNKDITLQNRISVLADHYTFDHFYDIRWVEYAGARWEVTNIDVASPRIILTLGGIWNGQKT